MTFDEFKKLKQIYTKIQEIEDLSQITNNKLMSIGKNDLQAISKIGEIYLYSCNLGLILYLKFLLTLVFSFLREVVKLFFFKALNKEISNNLISSDVLALTHLVLSEDNSTHIRLLDDLLNRLQLRCQLGVLMYPQANRLLRKKLSKENPKMSLLKGPIGYKETLTIILRNCRLAIRILRLSRSKRLDREIRRFLGRCSIYQLASAAFQDLLVAKELSNKIDVLQPHTFFLPYEGHSLELTIISQLQQSFPNLRICAYQHAPVSNCQLGFFRGLSLFSSNTYLLTTGEVVKEIALSDQSIVRERIRVLGSNKSHVQARGGNFDKRVEGEFIFLPEASRESIDSCLDFLEEWARFIDIKKFTMRLHPRTSIMYKEILRKKLFHSNFISKDSMSVALQRSSFCVYQSSSTVIEAMQYGVIPIFYSRLPRVLLDPLVPILQIPKFSHMVRGFIGITPQTLKQINDLDKIRGDACEVSFKYFEPFNETTLSWISLKH